MSVGNQCWDEVSLHSVAVVLMTLRMRLGLEVVAALGFCSGLIHSEAHTPIHFEAGDYGGVVGGGGSGCGDDWIVQTAWILAPTQLLL